MRTHLFSSLIIGIALASAAGAEAPTTTTGLVQTGAGGADCPPGTARDAQAVAKAMTQAKGDAKAEASALAYIPCVPVNNSTLTTIGSDSSNLVKAPAIKPVQLQPPVAKPKQ